MAHVRNENPSRRRKRPRLIHTRSIGGPAGRIAFLGLLASLGAAADEAAAATVMINNGLEPPALTNVLSNGTNASNSVYVRSAGCPPLWPFGAPADPCPSPGAPTAVELAAGGNVAYLLGHDISNVYVTGGNVLSIGGNDDSRFHMSGGTAGSISINETASLRMDGGSVTNSFICSDNGNVRMDGGVINSPFRILGDCAASVYGGTFNGVAEAYNRGGIAFFGGNFQLNGVPIPNGPIAATSGTLTGTLLSGDTISVVIYHAGYSALLSGVISVHSTAFPVPGLGAAGAVAYGAALLVTGYRLSRTRRTRS